MLISITYGRAKNKISIMNLYETIKSKITVREIIEELYPITLRKDGDNIYTGSCFKCGGSENGTKFRAFPNGFLCFNCDIKGNLINLIEQIKGISYKEAYKYLVKTYTPEEKYTAKKYRHTKQIIKEESNKNSNPILDGNLYESLVERGKKALFEPEGKNTLDYLVDSRKYSIKNIKESDFFFMPSVEKCQKYLANKYPKYKEYIYGISKDKGAKLSLKGGNKKPFSLGIPYRNDDGIIIGLVFRSIIPTGEIVERYDRSSRKMIKTKEPKRYDATKGLSKSSLFNINKSETSSDILVVEGYPDATYISTYSNLNICAIGQGSLSDSNIKSLIKRKVKSVILSLDNDEVKEKKGIISEVHKLFEKHKRTINAIEKLSKENIPTFVINPDALGKVKDIDEKYRESGIEGVRQLLENKLKSVDYLIGLIESGQALMKEDFDEMEMSRFAILKYDEFVKCICKDEKEIFESLFIDKFSDSTISKKSIEQLKRLLDSERFLTEEELLGGLTRLVENDSKLLSFLQKNSINFNEIFDKKHQPIFQFIFCQTGLGQPNLKLNKRMQKRFERIQNLPVINLIPKKLLEELLIKSIKNIIYMHYDNLLKKAQDISLTSIDAFYQLLNILSKLHEEISNLKTS